MLELGVAAAGLATSAYGLFEKNKGAQEQEAAQEAMIGTQQQENAVKQQAAEVNYRRQQMESIRNAQRARSQALAVAAGSGAQFGSGLQGAYGNVAGASGNNQLNIGQNRMASEQMFGLSNQLSAEEIQYAKAGGLVNEGSGLMGLGSGVTSFANSALKGVGPGFGGGGSAG